MASVASPALSVTVRQASRVSSTSDHRVCLSTVNVSSSAMIFRRPACITSSAKRLNRTEVWSDWRKCGSKKLRHVVALHSLRRRGNGMRQSRIVSEMAGQYEENFSDVDKVRMDRRSAANRKLNNRESANSHGNDVCNRVYAISLVKYDCSDMIWVMSLLVKRCF